MADAQHEHLRLALELHRKIGVDGENSCFSPYSIASALGMVFQASRGQTADEIRQLLSPDASDIAKQVDLLRAAATLPALFDGDDEPILAVSNTLWAWDQLPVKDSFVTDLSGWPGAKVATAPFRTDPEAARQSINADVAETTRDLIPELVPVDAIDDGTVAALVNALYLKTFWMTPFPEHSTVDQPFAAPSGAVDVPMMGMVKSLPYAASAGWTAVGLRANGGVDAVALLPDGQLPESEATLDADALSAVLAGLRSRRVALRFPRFNVAVNAPLRTVLKDLGAATMFDKFDADLTGLAEPSGDKLYVSEALHQAVLKFDENGLEGAAASAMMASVTSLDPTEPVEVRFDRPFLLLVRHAETGAVYFMARISDPS